MRRGLVAALVAALLAPAAATASDFDDPASNDPSQQFTPSGHVQRDDTPDDPDYDRAEDPENATTNLYDERFDLFGFPSKLTPGAIYKDGPNAGKRMVAGFNAAGAWKLDRGRDDVFVAILDTGIKWDRAGLRRQVRLNKGELPKPLNAADYDADGNGVFDVDDYKDDPRVNNPKPTGQDLIKAFSDGTDADGNGYADDIAGWDFFDDDNDPFDASSYFAASNHGSGRAQEAVERGNDGDGSIGVCPKCQFVPLRIWDTFVSDQTTFALGVLYAADLGAQIIEGASGGLYHSAFAEQASEYAYRKGSVQVYSGDDLNTGNHNYPANYSHTMLIQGTVADTYGLGTDVGPEAAAFLGGLGVPLGTIVPTLTLFRGAGTTQYGGHSSVSMIGATGSENTGKAAGAAALVVSAALNRPDPVKLTPDETRIILEQTAEDVTAANGLGVGLADRAVDGWDPHFGWGRVNLGEAVRVAREKIPPEAAIWTPDWFAPLTGDSVQVTGRARARHSDKPFSYKVEWGVGETPTSWTTVKEGTSSTEVNDLGSINLGAVRDALENYVVPFDTGGPTFAPGSPSPFGREWTVRLTVTADGVTTKGVDRRVFNALDDPTLRKDFPKRLGTGGEAPLRYADLDGDNEQELVVPLEDGTVHAWRPDGTELPGWPVKTDLMAQAAAHPDAPGIADVGASAPPREPTRAPAIADLDGDGSPEVVTTAGRRIYAWQADGRRVDGFPVAIDPAFCRGEDNKQDRVHRKCGFLASPAIGYLEGRDKPPTIVAPALDGRVYAVRPDGTALPGFPAQLVDPDLPAAEKMYAESINAPALGDLDGDGKDDVVVATNESYGGAPPGTDLLSAVLSQAGGSSRLYAVSGADGSYLDGWPVALNGAIQDTLPLIGPGHDAAIAEVGGETVVVASTTGSAGIQLFGADGSAVRTLNQQLYGLLSNATDRVGSINLFESAIVADLLGAGQKAVVKYGLTITAAANLLLVGQNLPYNHLINAFDATTGLPIPAFPRITDDYQFLSSSTVAKVNPSSPANQVLAGNGLGMLHAYDGLTGAEAPGFPKTTGGWLFAPAAVSDDGRLAGLTREGYLFEWDTDAPRCQPAGVWDSYRHDPRGTGNADTDATAPGAPEDGKLERVGGDRWKLTFTSPGDDRLCGTPARYEGTDAAAAEAGETVTDELTLTGKGTVEVWAVDEAGNRGPSIRLPYDSATTPEPTPSPTTTAPSPSPTGTASPGPTPGSTPTPAPGTCTDARPPRSSFTVRRINRKRVVLRGRSADRGCAKLGRVVVAIARRTRGDRCRSLRRDGTFGTVRSCRRKTYLGARGTRRWSITVKGRFPRGKYIAFVRASDRKGNFERRSKANRVRLQVR